MKTIIETPRFFMREIVEDDAADLYELDTDPEVHKYLGNIMVQHIDESIDAIKKIRQQYADYGMGRLAVIEKSSGNFVGWSGLKYETMDINGQKGYYDLGYRLKKAYWKKGIGTETAIESLKYGFEVLDLPEICAAAHLDNIGSNKILQRVGMQLVNTFEFEDMKCNWYRIENPKC